jgi:hypothetical protein
LPSSKRRLKTGSTGACFDAITVGCIGTATSTLHETCVRCTSISATTMAREFLHLSLLERRSFSRAFRLRVNRIFYFLACCVSRAPQIVLLISLHSYVLLNLLNKLFIIIGDVGLYISLTASHDPRLCSYL